MESESSQRDDMQIESEITDIQEIEGQEGSPGNAEMIAYEIMDQQQEQESASPDHVEVHDVELEQNSNNEEGGHEEQERVFVNTGQSFGDINAAQRSSNRERNEQQQPAEFYQQTFQQQYRQEDLAELQQQMNEDLANYEADMDGQEGAANFLVSNWQQQFDGALIDGEEANNQGGVQDRQEQHNSHESFGTGSFTTNTFNVRLAGDHGMQILKYVQSEEFGKYGESIKLVANIQEFMTKLGQENARLEEENAILSKSNEQFQGLTQLNQGKLQQSVNNKHNIARQVTDLEAIYHKYDGAEAKFNRREKNYKKDMGDLIEYTKWITEETAILRERVRKAEAVISSLRKSGESSVESLLKTLYKLRQQQQKLEAEADLLRMHVRTKETMIKMKEDEKGTLKANIENEKREQDLEFMKLRKQLDEQKTLISNQRKLLNKLQVLNEVSQGCITQSAQDLATKTREKQSLSLQINDKQREQEKLKTRHEYLQKEIKNCIPMTTGQDGMPSQKYNPEDVTILEGQHRKFNVPNQCYVDVNKHKIRSKMAIFSETKNPIVYDSIANNE